MLSREILPLSHNTIRICCCHRMPCRSHKSGTLSFSPLNSSPHEHLHYGGFKQHFSQSIINLEETPRVPCWTGTVPARRKEAMWWSQKNIPWTFWVKDIPWSKVHRRWVGRNRRKAVTDRDINCDSLELEWTYSEPARGALPLTLFVHIILKQLMH